MAAMAGEDDSAAAVRPDRHPRGVVRPAACRAARAPAGARPRPAKLGWIACLLGLARNLAVVYSVTNRVTHVRPGS